MMVAITRDRGGNFRRRSPRLGGQNCTPVSNIRLARKLVAEKAEVRALERRATEAHLSRISSGRRESIETSTLHLDILRDLKRINAHIASVAYPILEQRGELVETRLRPPADTPPRP